MPKLLTLYLLHVLAIGGAEELAIDDYAKDGGKELFTKMHCVL